MRLQRSMTFLGRSKIAYTLTKPLYPRVGASSLGPHVWRARSSDSNQKEVIVKFCKPDTTQSRSDFQKEILQSQKFKEARYIRKILDVIEDDPNRKGTDTNNCEGMVLESFPETLWEARENGRLSSFGLAGIRKIMKDALLGIQELHAEGVIHLGLRTNYLASGPVIRSDTKKHP
ncbi:hypothetical protein FQN50_003366 [Emmonsiellopsis sp. PD_5]|nr:hypothetical protein FQN50_003366 [Emmonsiellopsis sp. PD_5]